jgi:ElaA protein
VFVVEQACPYPELDGRDTEPETEHRWLPGADGAPVGAYLRVLTDAASGGRRIGRVVTAPASRGHGLAGRLVDAVLADHGGGPLVLDAQAHLEHWYARWGFTADGPEFLEDGIPHVPMRRDPSPAVG